MKKKTLLLVSFLLVICLVSVFVACDHTHAYGDWTITTEPTETEGGYAKRVCTVENCFMEEIVKLPLLTDSSVWSVFVDDATEDKDGKKTYTSEYGTVTVVIPALGHTHVFDQEQAIDSALATPATCIESASYYKSCKCGELGTETFEYGASAGHTFGAWVDEVPSNCTQDGVKGHKVCSVCNKNFDNEGVEITDLVIVVDAGAHNFGTWIDEVPAKCTVNGVKGHKDCLLCNKHFGADNSVISDSNLVISANGHDMKEIVADYAHKSDANCLSPAVYWKICSVCHDLDTVTFTNGEIGAHSIVDGVCSVCSKVRVIIDSDNSSDVTVLYIAKNTSLGEDLPKAPVKDGNIFLGWYANNSVIEADTKISTGVTVIAKWGSYSDFANKDYRYAYTTNGGVALNYSGSAYHIHTNEVGVATVVGDSTSAPVYPGSTLSFCWFDKDNSIALIIENYNYSTTEEDSDWGVDTTVSNTGVRYYLAVVDPVSGIIVRAQISLSSMPTLDTEFDLGSSVFCLVPATSDVESITADLYKGIKLETLTNWVWFISYKETNIYVFEDHVYFGVTLTTAIDKKPVTVDKIVNEGSVIVTAGDTVVARYGLVDGKFIVLDEFVGSYTSTEGDKLVVSGNGSLVLGSSNCTYTKAAAGSDYTLDVYRKDDAGVSTAYYRITLSGNSFSIVEPMATVTFVSNEDGTTAPSAGSYNINIKHVLPVMAHTATKTFKGWALDDGSVVSDPYLVTADVTLTAVWSDKVIVNVVNEFGSVDKIYLGDGDIIGDFLADCIGTSDTHYFVGWKLDMNGNGVIDDEDIDLEDDATLSPEDSGVTVIAVWAKIPSYVGSYTGSFLRNASYTFGSSKTLNITVDGKISGTYTGTVVSYSAGKLVWKDSSLDQHTFLFDEATEVLVYTITDDSGYDFAVFGKNLASDGKVTKQEGVPAKKKGSDNKYADYAQFIKMPTAQGTDTLLFHYGDELYSNVTVKNAVGDTLTIGNFRSSDSVVVYDSNGDRIFAVVAPKSLENLGKCLTYGDKAPVTPDEYFGIYTNETLGTLVIKGNGAFVWGDKSGDYSATDSGIESYVVVDGDNTEFYSLVLDSTNMKFTATKVNVNITYASDITAIEGLPEVDSVNKNIEFTLPVLTATDHVFRGWKVAGDETVYTSIAPSADITLTAVWDAKYSLTVVYGNGLDNAVLYYGAGDITAPVEPELTNGKVFDYWYLSDDNGATESKKYTPSAINGNTTIYVAWVNPPIFMNSYYGAKFWANDNYTSTFSSNPLTFDRKGNAEPDGSVFTNSSSYKNVSLKLTIIDSTTGAISIVHEYDSITTDWYTDEETITHSKSTYYGFIDSATGIIILNASRDSSSKYTYVWILIPTDTKLTKADFKTIKAWDDTKPFAYVGGDSSFGIFANGSSVYMGVDFVDESSSAIADISDLDSFDRFIVKKNGTLIAEYACDGSKLQLMDGYQGAYEGTLDGVSNSLTLNGMGGVVDANGVHGTYAKLGDTETFDFYTLDSDGNKTAYYVLTLDKTAKTYTATKPTVTVTYVSDYDQANAVGGAVNKNVPISLLTGLTDADHIFVGWYVQGDESQRIVTKLTPVEDITYVAKWLDKVTLTVVYGNGLDNGIFDFSQGSAVVLDDYKVIYNNGKLFDGWFSDADCTTSVSLSVIDADTTIYAKWIEHDPYSITDSETYPWDRTGDIWHSTNIGKNSSNSTITITVYVDTVVSFKYACESEHATKWDYFHIDINKSTMVTAGGAKSDTNSIDIFTDYTVTLKAGDVMTLVYQKDGSSNKDADMAVIKDFVIYPVVHDHNLQDVVDDAYIKDPATCEDFAVYYKSCTICKQASTETFNGTVLGNHSYSEHVCTVCGDDQPKYVLTVMTNNGPASNYNVYLGETIDMDSLDALVGVKDGFYFDGWFLDAAFQNEFTLTTITETTTIYAKWSAALSLNGAVFKGKYYNEWDEWDHNLTLTFTSDTEATLLEGGDNYPFNTAYTCDGTVITFTITSCIVGNSAVGKTFIGTLNNKTITFSKGTFYSSNVYTFYNGATVTSESFIAPHSCVFDQETVSEEFLASAATCNAKATYYKHCAVCDALGSETFESGEFSNIHDYVDDVCRVCGKDKPVDNFDVTFVLGNGSADITISVKENASVGDSMPKNPDKDGFVFDGWFVGDVEFTADTVITANTTVTAAWRDPAPFENNEYRYVQFYTGSVGVSYSGDDYAIVTNKNGVATVVGNSTSAPVYPGSTITISWLNESDNTVVIREDYNYSTNSGTRYYWGLLDRSTGIIFRCYTSCSSLEDVSSALDSAVDMGSTVYTLIPSSSAISTTSLSGCRTSTLTNHEWTVSYNNGTKTTCFFITGTTLYSDVSFKDANGSSLVAGNVSKSSFLYIAKGEELIVAYGKNAENKFIPLDGNQGSYTGTEGTLVIDGIGKATLGSENGLYTATENANELDLYIKNSSGNNAKYAIITLDKENKTYTIVVPNVTLTFITAYSSVDEIVTNKNIEIDLPSDLTSDTHIFRGWYIEGDASQSIVASHYKPTANATFVAKWDAKVTLTVVYGNGLEDAVLNYAVGDTTAPVEPEPTAGKAFDHWYISNDAGVTEDSVYTPGAISESMTIYCAWKDSSPLIGTYKGFEAWGSVNGTNGNLASRSDLVIDADGKAISGPGISGKTATNYNETTGVLYFGTYWAYYDSVNGILLYNYSSGGTAMKDDIYVMIKGADSLTNSSGSTVTNAIQFAWNKGLNRLIDIKVTKGETSESYILYIADNKLQKVTIVTDSADIDTASEIYTSSKIQVNSLKIYSLTGDLLGEFAKSSDGKSMLELDGSQGTYTLDGASDLVLSGTGLATIGDNSGTVTAAAEGSSYTYDLYITEGSVKVYYELTVDIDAKTYTVNKPMVTVSFDLGGKGTLEDISVNKNIELSLSDYAPSYEGFVFKGWFKESALSTAVTKITPTSDTTVYAKWNAIVTLSFETEHDTAPVSKTYEENTYAGVADRPTLSAEGYIFRGWYIKGDETQKLQKNAILMTENMTLVAKWDVAIYLTIVYNKDDLANAVITTGAGDTLDLDDCIPRQATDGEVFDAWYTDEACTTPFTATSISESTTIYCGWKEPFAYMGTYKGANVYSSSGEENKTTISKTLTIDGNGNVTGQGSGTLTENGDTFKYGSSPRNVDIDNGVVYDDFSTNRTLGQSDINVYFIVKEGNVTPTSINGSAWLSGTAKLLTCTYSDGSTNTAFYYNGKIYGNVTFTAIKDGTAVTEANAVYNASTLVVYDSNGVEVGNFTLVDGSLQPTVA